MFGRSARSALQQMPQPTLPPMQSSQQAGLQQAFQQRQSPPGGMQMGLMGQSPGLQPQSAGQSAMQQSPSGQLALQQAFQQRQPSPGGMQMGMGMGLQPQQAGSPGQTAAGFGNPYEAALQQMQQQGIPRQNMFNPGNSQMAMQQPTQQQMQDFGQADTRISSEIQGLDAYKQLESIGDALRRGQLSPEQGRQMAAQYEQQIEASAPMQQRRQLQQQMQGIMMGGPPQMGMLGGPPQMGMGMPPGQAAAGFGNPYEAALQQMQQQAFQQQQQMGALGQTPPGSMQTGMGMPPQQMALQQALMQQQSMPQGQVPIGIPGQTLGFLGSQQGGLASLVPPQIRAMPAPPRRGFSSFGSRR